MSSHTALIAEMAILVGIFLLGFVAKMFPRKTGNRNRGTVIKVENSTTQR